VRDAGEAGSGLTGKDPPNFVLWLCQEKTLAATIFLFANGDIWLLTEVSHM
jgi:hypothetical protein